MASFEYIKWNSARFAILEFGKPAFLAGFGPQCPDKDEAIGIGCIGGR